VQCSSRPEKITCVPRASAEEVSIYYVYYATHKSLEICLTVFCFSPSALADEAADSASSTLPATPLYNLAILEDMALLTQHRILQRTLAPSAPLAKALVLLKVCSLVCEPL
jgi:hypothetical protein